MQPGRLRSGGQTRRDVSHDQLLTRTSEALQRRCPSVGWRTDRLHPHPDWPCPVGADRPKSEAQPRAEQIGHAPQPRLARTDGSLAGQRIDDDGRCRMHGRVSTGSTTKGNANAFKHGTARLKHISESGARLRQPFGTLRCSCEAGEQAELRRACVLLHLGLAMTAVVHCMTCGAALWRSGRDADETRCWMEGVMKTEISGKEAARVAEDMAKPGPIRVVEPQRSPRGTRRSRAIAWVRTGPKGASACPKAFAS